MLFSSGNAPRKIEEKWSFLLYFARFALSLMLRIQGTHVRKNKRNKYFLSFFAHLIVPLTLRVQDRLHLGNAKEKRVFLLYFARFALSLMLRIQGTHVREYKRKMYFLFVFYSLNRTFAKRKTNKQRYGRN